VGVNALGAIELAAIRPNEWELPLFVHVLGALALTGAVVLTFIYLASAWRTGSEATLRLGVRSLLIGILPAWIVLRISAEWIADKEGYADLDEQPDWIGLGYMATDLGFLLIVISGVLSWLALRKVRGGDAGPKISARVAAGMIGFLVVLNIVAIWAMTTKPA
jgi:hypothetical protein